LFAPILAQVFANFNAVIGLLDAYENGEIGNIDIVGSRDIVKCCVSQS